MGYSLLVIVTNNRKLMRLDMMGGVMLLPSRSFENFGVTSRGPTSGGPAASGLRHGGLTALPNHPDLVILTKSVARVLQ